MAFTDDEIETVGSLTSFLGVIQNFGNDITDRLRLSLQKKVAGFTSKNLEQSIRFGSFDAYNFNLRSQKTEEVKRTSYKKNKYPIVTAGQNRLYQDAAQVVNYVETQEFLTVRSDYLTTEQNDWLKQLISSPEIYLEITDHTGAQNFVAYEMVTNSSWVEKETSIDKLWILELRLRLSQANSRQRR